MILDTRRGLDNTEISNFIKIHPVKADMFHAGGRADGRTDRQDEANNRFLQFCKRIWTASTSDHRKIIVT